MVDYEQQSNGGYRFNESEIGPSASSWGDENVKGHTLIKGGSHRGGLHIRLLVVAGEHL